MWTQYEDITFGGETKFGFEVPAKLRRVLKSTLQVDCNLTKHVIFDPGLNGTSDPTRYFTDVYRKHKSLCNISIYIDVTILLGINFGTNKFVSAHSSKMLKLFQNYISEFSGCTKLTPTRRFERLDAA